MTKLKSFPKIAALPVLLLAASPALAQVNATFSQNSRNGVCYFSVQGPNAPATDKPMTLEFSYRVRDGNLGVSILVNGWPKAQAANPDTVVPVTLVLDSGTTKPSRSGGYASGFNDRLWAGWGAENSPPIMDLLKTAKVARLEADGMRFGSFDLQIRGLAHTSLTQCADRVRAGES